MKTFRQLLEQSSETWIGTTDHKENNHLQNFNDRIQAYSHHGPAIHDTQEVSEEELHAADRYSKGGYDPINKYHRTGDIEKKAWGNAEQQDPATVVPDRTKHLDSIISKHTIKNNLHVWRGVDDDPKEFIKSLNQGGGHILHDKGYVSTSLDPKIAQASRNTHIMHIKVPKGSKGLHLNSYPKTYPFQEEHEVLLPRGSKFRYEGSEKGINHKGSDITIHHLTHIPE